VLRAMRILTLQLPDEMIPFVKIRTALYLGKIRVSRILQKAYIIKSVLLLLLTICFYKWIWEHSCIFFPLQKYN